MIKATRPKKQTFRVATEKKIAGLGFGAHVHVHGFEKKTKTTTLHQASHLVLSALRFGEREI